MKIVVVGADHTTAPIALRERLSCSARQISQVLSAARQTSQESVLLSTCNRIELYAVCEDEEQGRADLLRVLSESRDVASEELSEHCYFLTGQDAINHILSVACGLLSLVPGEPQIQGQVVDALEIAQGAGFCGPILSALFRAAVTTGKRARSETGISRNAASLSHVAVQLARHLFPSLQDAAVLLIGSGQMSELAARNLYDNGARNLTVVNRTYEHATDLVSVLGAQHRTFNELAETLVHADVAISSTKAPVALVTREMMDEVMVKRDGRPLLLIDLALPRDVEPSVSELTGVHLYNIDDLQSEVNRGIDLRWQEAEHVRTIIAQESTQFENWLASLGVVGTISDLRRHADLLREQELARTLRQLSSTLSEREAAAIQELTHRLVNKLLHVPTLRLKDAAAVGQGHVYAEAARYLFALENGHEKDYDRNASQQARHDTDPVDRRADTSAVART
ncbi:glutamyl-tRNA reductase [Ktedonospora formicarum]|uniref:Glutamyl-tRNA reductase n=1 Tax=Ktedonospora formicarum TaxID=2778364 RepID=A0A8J3MYV3_9CHLR|nr:glutamyl-tRNA reductase [Ktedonospora formicarum]GHO50075.1 glutamyl-tRNA reductase [Ktedonospora formicarum]